MKLKSLRSYFLLAMGLWAITPTPCSANLSGPLGSLKQALVSPRTVIVALELCAFLYPYAVMYPYTVETDLTNKITLTPSYLQRFNDFLFIKHAKTPFPRIENITGTCWLSCAMQVMFALNATGKLDQLKSDKSSSAWDYYTRQYLPASQGLTPRETLNALPLRLQLQKEYPDLFPYKLTHKQSLLTGITVTYSDTGNHTFNALLALFGPQNISKISWVIYQENGQLDFITKDMLEGIHFTPSQNYTLSSTYQPILIALASSNKPCTPQEYLTCVDKSSGKTHRYHLCSIVYGFISQRPLGLARGNHGVAYVRNGEKWYLANDSDIREGVWMIQNTWRGTTYTKTNLSMQELMDHYATLAAKMAPNALHTVCSPILLAYEEIETV